MAQSRRIVRGLAERLRSAREAAGLTQIQAGKKSGVHQVSISQFELGKHTPTIPTLCKLAEVYGLDVCDLLRDQSKLGTRSVPQKEAEPARPSRNRKGSAPSAPNRSWPLDRMLCIAQLGVLRMRKLPGGRIVARRSGNSFAGLQRAIPGRSIRCQVLFVGV